MTDTAPVLSIIAPVHNEENSIEELHRTLRNVLDDSGIPFELIFIDDGSLDGSLARIKNLSARDSRVRYASFSRNFGHEAASTCGFRMARGSAVVLIDADMQDPPDVIPRMYELWLQGFEVVYARRLSRTGEGLLKKVTSHLFYRVLNAFSSVKIPLDVGDFRLVDRKVVDAFNQLPERNRFVRGMFAWLGFKQCAVEYSRPPRKSGKTKYNWVRLTLLSMDAIFSFSLVPLRICILFGLVTILFSFLMGAYIAGYRLFHGLDIPGYALLTVGMFFLGGVQLTFLGVIGEYVGKIYNEAQSRPLYLVSENSDEGNKPGRPVPGAAAPRKRAPATDIS